MKILNGFRNALPGFALVVVLLAFAGSAMAQQAPATPVQPDAPPSQESVPAPSQPETPVQPDVPSIPETTPPPSVSKPAQPTKSTTPPAAEPRPEYTPPPYYQLSGTPVVPKQVKRGGMLVITFKGVRANVLWPLKVRMWASINGKRKISSRKTLKPGQRRTMKFAVKAPVRGGSFQVHVAAFGLTEGDPAEDFNQVRGTRERTFVVRLR